MRPRQRSSNRARLLRAPRILAAAIALALAHVPVAAGQKTTEQFIPIGRSPGLSGIVTYVGEIVATDPGTLSLTMRRPGDAGTATVTVAGDTRIWLDRSAAGLPNLTGGFADLTIGGVAEIHFRDSEQRMAAWIKIQADR